MNLRRFFKKSPEKTLDNSPININVTNDESGNLLMTVTVGDSKRVFRVEPYDLLKFAALLEYQADCCVKKKIPSTNKIKFTF